MQEQIFKRGIYFTFKGYTKAWEEAGGQSNFRGKLPNSKTEQEQQFSSCGTFIEILCNISITFKRILKNFTCAH